MVSFCPIKAVGISLYSVGRYFISKGYAESRGDPMARYNNPLARYMWRGMIMVTALGAASCVNMMVNGLPFAR